MMLKKTMKINIGGRQYREREVKRYKFEQHRQEVLWRAITRKAKKSKENQRPTLWNSCTLGSIVTNSDSGVQPPGIWKTVEEEARTFKHKKL